MTRWPLPVTQVKPNTFLVGAPRCGTTSLSAYLGQHPEVFFSGIKEPHYFCTDFVQECDTFHGRKRYFAIRRLEQYLWLFRSASPAKVIGEASVGYLRSRVAAHAIQAFNPDARILIMVREPVDFLRSLHEYSVNSGEEDCPDLGRAVELEANRRAGHNLPRHVRLPSLLYYNEAVTFAAQIERYLAVFTPARVRVIVHDDFVQDTARVWREVLDFLNLTQIAVPPRHERNAATEPRWPWLSRWLNSPDFWMAELYRSGMPPDPEFARGWIGRALPPRAVRRVRDKLRRLNDRPSRRRLVPEDVRQTLMARLKPEVERLGALLGRDLVKSWRY